MVKPLVQVHRFSLVLTKLYVKGFLNGDLYDHSMDQHEARRLKFVRYFNDGPLQGDRQELMARTNLSKGRISQLMQEGAQFGELAAKNMAASLGLPENAFLETGTGAKQDALPMDPGKLLELALVRLRGALTQQSPTRRATLKDMLGRFAIDPENDELVDDIVSYLSSPSANGTGTDGG